MNGVGLLTAEGVIVSNNDNPLVSVAILTWNRRQHVTKAIDSVLAQDYRPIEIVVVDSASSDGTADFVAQRYPEVKVIRLHRNLGCPEGRNIALVNCSGDFIFALDDDGWLASNALSVCVDRFRRYPSAGVVDCRIMAPNEKVEKADSDEWHHTFNGGASAIRRVVLESAGYYPSDFFRQAEEGDLSLRMLAIGYEILFCPEAVMFHELSPINRNDKLFLYYNVRNELYTVVRRYPWGYVLPVAFQKIVIWNYLGLRRGSVFHSMAGAVNALLQLPRLIRERSPVSSEAVRKLWAMKAKTRFSRSPNSAEQVEN